MLVSSMKLPKLAMNGILPSASPTRQCQWCTKHGIRAIQKQGFHGVRVRKNALSQNPLNENPVPQRTRIWTEDACSTTEPLSNFQESTFRQIEFRPACRHFRAARFKAFTAIPLKKPFVWAIAASPIKAIAASFAAASRAICM